MPRAGDHPNGVLRTDRVYIVVPDVAAAAETYSRVLGMPVPPIQRGAEALARRGPGPFQALYRTSSMDAAARWMADHGVPPPARGVRNTGEQAMLVRPEDACGAYIGFVGPA